MIQHMRERAQMERKAELESHKRDMIRLGYYAGDSWQDGEAFVECDKRLAAIVEERSLIETRKVSLQNTKLSLQGMHNYNNLHLVLARRPTLKESDYMDQFYELLEQENVFKLRLSHLKKEEALVLEERSILHTEKVYHLFESETLKEQEHSKYANFPLLQDRYLLVKLLAKGMNSTEIYKAYDFIKLRHVTCKIQFVLDHWSEPYKDAIFKNVLHEVQIHKTLIHPRIVKLLDSFKMDNLTMVSVMEYCPGVTLSQYIKAHPRIPEYEAKSIIAQVFSGLKCLQQSQGKKIAHCNLTPDNILYHQGEIKLIDFGAAKQLEQDDLLVDAVLPEMGAFLPPECIALFGTDFPAKISTSTDVWSAGIILYQLLFGKKPYSSDSVSFSEQTLLNIVTLEFPDDVLVSDEGKEFLRNCLLMDADKRPDAVTMNRSTYLRPRLAPAS